MAKRRQQQRGAPLEEIETSPKQIEINGYLDALTDANGGMLTPEIVLDAAQDPDSPIHDQFDWDDQEAAHKFRLVQARKIIKSRKIGVVTRAREPISIALYVADPEVKKTHYRPLSSVKSNNDAEHALLQAEFVRLRASLNRLRGIAEYFGTGGKVDEFIEQSLVLEAVLTGRAGDNPPPPGSSSPQPKPRRK